MLASVQVVVVIAMLLMPVSLKSQDFRNGICRIENGRVIFRIDLNWTRQELKKVAEQFNLDTLLLQKVLAGKADSIMLAGGWQLKMDGGRVAELSQMMAPEPPQKPNIGKVTGPTRLFLMDDNWLHVSGLPEPEQPVYGVNRLDRTDIFNYSDSTARFFLPGYPDARQVYLSGTFNDWSTGQTLMKKTEAGWEVSLKLKPGKYAYKYIIDGRWTRDAANKLREDDLNGGYNSVIFCYNYRFILKGYTDARQVVLAGSFNGFNTKALQMVRTEEGWELPMFLHPGTHAYKFIVDGKWMTDPGNPVVRPDGRGNFNSFMGIGDTTWFRLKGHESVKSMILTGSFNGWNTAELIMEKTAGGWQLPYIMAPGNYEYKYIADGRWMTDTANPCVNGEGKFANSFMSVKPNHVFILEKYPNAKKVLVTGSFNGWNESSFRMVLRNGRWELPLYLGPGKQTYKFIVDGKWIRDPANEVWDENEYGTGNSVLWIDR